MNGYDLLLALQRAAEARRRTRPLLVIISCSADEAKARAAGAHHGRAGGRGRGWLLASLVHGWHISSRVSLVLLTF